MHRNGIFHRDVKPWPWIKPWKHWYVWIMIRIMSLDMDNFLDMDMDMDKHTYNMRTFSSSTRWFRYDFGEAGEPFAARRGEARLIGRRDCWCHPTCNGPRNAGWDQASRPWQLSWYLLAAAVWAAQVVGLWYNVFLVLCQVVWNGIGMIAQHGQNMPKPLLPHSKKWLWSETQN